MPLTGCAMHFLSASIVVIVDELIPIAAAIAAGSRPWGVPNTVSNPGTPRCGRVEKMPPPSLLITIKVQLISSRLINPVKSWRNERSPKMAKVCLLADAIPNAVEMLPSIPAKPRLAYVATPVRGVAKPSKSRIGRDEDTTNELPTGSAAAISLAIVASVNPFNASIFFLHRAAYFCHCANHSSLAGCVLSEGISVNRLSALRSLSTVAIRGSMTIWVGANFI